MCYIITHSLLWQALFSYSLQECWEKSIVRNRVDILFEHWRRKIRIIDDEGLYRVLHCIVTILAIGLTTFCDILFISKKDYILFFILNVFLFIYNKPTILGNIIRRRNVFLLLDSTTLKRYVMFEALKENPLIVVSIFANLFTLVYSLFINKSFVVLLMILLMIDYYVIEIYQRYQKMCLLLFIGCLVLSLFGTYPIIMFAAIMGNIIYLYKTFYKQLLERIYANKYHGIFIRRDEINASRVDMLYFLRMPLDKVIEILYEILLFGVALYYLDIGLVSYLVIAIFMVEIELLQAEKMEAFEQFYGQRNFMELTRLSKLKKFALSLEFNNAIKYIFLSFWIFCIQIFMNKFSINTMFIFFNLVVLIIGISYRSYCATDIVLKNRTDIRQSWFRLVMLYLVLFNLAPFIFSGTLMKLEGYCVIYGNLFACCINLIMFLVKVEKITNVLGEERIDENNE